MKQLSFNSIFFLMEILGDSNVITTIDLIG